MNGYRINFADNTISITADFAKKMNDPKSAEYKTIAKIIKDFPKMEIVHRTHRTPTSYKTKSGDVCRRNQFKNLTYERMERFMDAIPNGDEYRKQYDFVRLVADGAQGSAYAVVRKWFMEQFPNYRKNPIFYLNEANSPKVIYFNPELKQAYNF